MGLLAGRNFGLLISYVLPGFAALLGLSAVSPTLENWLKGIGSEGPSAGGVVYLLLASLGAGLTANAYRWLLIDTLHAWTGLERPKWDDSVLWRRQHAYELLIEIHYNYYKFYANSAISILAASVAMTMGREMSLFMWLLIAVTLTVFVCASRNALKSYYQRAEVLLAGRRKGKARMIRMVNGGHHPKPDGDKKADKPKPTTNSPGDPKTPSGGGGPKA